MPYGDIDLPDGSKPLLQPMSTSHWRDTVAFTWESNISVGTQATIQYNEFENHIFQITATYPGGQKF